MLTIKSIRLNNEIKSSWIVLCDWKVMFSLIILKF